MNGFLVSNLPRLYQEKKIGSNTLNPILVPKN